MRRQLLTQLLLLSSGLLFAQSGPPMSDAQAQTERMFEALGGKSRWANLQSLYIKATHWEPSMKESYQSEIWRGINEFKLRIEQQSSSFHNVGLFSEEGGWIHRHHKDTLQVLSEERLKASKDNHYRNVYVRLQQIATDDTFIPVLNGQRLEFHKGGEFMIGFILDELGRPAIVISPNDQGGEQVSHYDKWHESAGFVHPAGGGPVDGNFYFITEIWEPSNKSFVKSYDVNYVPDSK